MCITSHVGKVGPKNWGPLVEGSSLGVVPLLKELPDLECLDLQVYSASQGITNYQCHRSHSRLRHVARFTPLPVEGRQWLAQKA